MNLRAAVSLLVLVASIAFVLPAANAQQSGGYAALGPYNVLAEDTVGTFLIGIVDYEDRDDLTTFNIMINGRIYELQDVDYAVGLSVSGGAGVGFKFKSGQPVTIPSGVSIGATSGRAKLNGLALQPAPEPVRNLRTNDQEKHAGQLRRQLYSTTFGDKSVVAVRVVANDYAYQFTEDVLRREVFGVNADGSVGDNDNINLSERYRECSFGAITMNPLASHTNNGVTIDNGVVSISVNLNANGNTDYAVFLAVWNKLHSTFGNDLTAVADYWMLCLPPNTVKDGSANWIGYAWVNYHISVYNDDWCNYPSLQMHEIGHNLNFAHSGQGTSLPAEQYGDQSCIMGYSYQEDESPVMCFNSAKSWQTGWYGQNGQHGDKTLSLSYGDDCFDGTISGTADYATTTNPVTIRMVNPNGSGEDMFLAFNAQKGINSGIKEFGDEVSIVRVLGGSGEDYSESKWVSNMVAGGSYTTNSNFGGETLNVEIDSITGSDTASIKVYFGSTCIVTTPAPTPAPTAVPTSAPTAVPTSVPTAVPSSAPSSNPSESPHESPSSIPSDSPSSKPSDAPSSTPSSSPSFEPSDFPSRTPSEEPSESPSLQPSTSPSASPSEGPSAQPSSLPSTSPSLQPSSTPSSSPSDEPSAQPSSLPSASPSLSPTDSFQPSSSPSDRPSYSGQPSSNPSIVPSSKPSSRPSATPTISEAPSLSPTKAGKVSKSRKISKAPKVNSSIQAGLLKSSGHAFSPLLSISSTLILVVASNTLYFISS